MKKPRRKPVAPSKRRKRRYVVLIESGPRNFSAYVPDLPGCVSTGRTLAEVRRNIREAIAFDGQGLTGNRPHPDRIRTGGRSFGRST